MNSTNHNPSIRESFTDVLISLLNVLRSAHRLVPFSVFACGWITLGVITVTQHYADVTVAIALCVILLSTLVVYVQTHNYGESALALAAGLLTLFSVDWNFNYFVAFFIAWVAFTLLALLISSLRLAARYEVIYQEAAVALDLKTTDNTIQEIKAIVDGVSNKRLGQIERAEVIRLFAYRKLPLSSMKHGLNAVTTLYIISRISHETIATFIADVYRMFSPIQETRYSRLLDEIYNHMRLSPVSPGEFIAAFNNSRRIALSKKIEPEAYFRQLRAALETGVAPDEMSEYLSQNEG